MINLRVDYWVRLRRSYSAGALTVISSENFLFKSVYDIDIDIDIDTLPWQRRVKHMTLQPRQTSSYIPCWRLFSVIARVRKPVKFWFSLWYIFGCRLFLFCLLYLPLHREWRHPRTVFGVYILFCLFFRQQRFNSRPNIQALCVLWGHFFILRIRTVTGPESLKPRRSDTRCQRKAPVAAISILAGYSLSL